jgi:hypothetical protein
MSRFRENVGWATVFAVALAAVVAAQSTPVEIKPIEGIIPSGFGESVDRDVARAREATIAFKSAAKALRSGYQSADNCIAHPQHGAMGYHYRHDALYDAKLQVDKPEILVYEKMADGSFKLNGVEYIVPIDAWKKDEAPTIMGQKLKRAENLGIWYLHVWIWEPSPSGIFADWNPRVKC